MILLIDLDNVAADLITAWLELYNSTFNDNIPREQWVKNWDIQDQIKHCSPEEFYGLIGTAGFFAKLDVLPNAIEVTKRLIARGHEVWFVTATPFNSPTGGYDKCIWVDKYFPHIGKHKVIQAHHKNMVKGDVLFDDGPHNIEQFSGLTVAMNFPYNEHIIADHRVNNWLEFEKIIIDVEAKFYEVGET